LRNHCPSCGLDFTKNDSADGPAVFLMFILGFLFVPLAVIIDFQYHWEFWLHMLVWPLVMGIIIILLLRPLKSLVIAIQYRYRQTDWD
jgi:uncharacterized protein (DUF983 family)